MWINRNFLLSFAFLLTSSRACIQELDGWKQVGLEERAKRSPVVFHGLAIETFSSNEDPFLYSVQFWLINVYKGAETVGTFLDLDPGSGGVFNLRDRKINVTGFSYKSKCHSTVASQKYYIIFCELRENELVAKFDDLFGASAEWSEKNERRVWHGVGWENWSDWGTCSASCGEGYQERSRKCMLEDRSCHGYNKERRRCNMFSCQGAVDPMKLDDRRFFHPSRGEWQRVAGRPAAWKLRPNSYVWVPSSQIFPNKSAGHRPGIFPREFSLLVTLKLSPKHCSYYEFQKELQGTLFSLRSRREQNTYLSLELEAPDRIRVVHSGANGTQAVIIPMKLNDGHWHQLGLALQDDNSVRSFLDCAWVSTDILKRNELDHPEDADLIIGYLFQGELEQLVIVPNPSAVAQQCSSSKIPIFDPTIRDEVSEDIPSENPRKKKQGGPPLRKGKQTGARGGKKHFRKSFEVSNFESENRQKKNNDLEMEEEELAEGSGIGFLFNNSNYEVEWSDWTACSTTCGSGVQTRFSRCVDDGRQLELCMEAGSERTETRSCFLNTCKIFSSAGTEAMSQGEGRPSEKFPPQSDYGLTSNSSPTGKNLSEIARLQRHLSDDQNLVSSDIYFSENQSVAAKKLHSHKIYNRRLTSNRSWDLLKRRLLRENGSKRSWCSCLNGGTCDQGGNFCMCPKGYWGRFCENTECHIDCLNGGQCLGSNLCSCPSGFHGDRCEIPKCDPPCRNGGTCIQPFTCLCPPQTTGSYCQKYFCRLPCLNGGTCVGPDQCECPHNATGRNCENPVCEPPCENGATCSPGNWCHCDAGSYGIRCERRKCEYVSVKEPFTRGYRRLISKKTETKCEPLSWKMCVRTVPEYQTIYKTFYRTVYKCKEDSKDNSQQ